MRIAIITLLAVMAIIGPVAAWDSSNTLVYQYQRTINMQANFPVCRFSGVNSSAGFDSPGAYGTESGFVMNRVNRFSVEPHLYDGVQGDTHSTLTQSGYATVNTQAPNTEAPSDIKESAYAMAGQNLHLSGGFEDLNTTTGYFPAAQVSFSEVASAGVGGQVAVGYVNPKAGKATWPIDTDEPNIPNYIYPTSAAVETTNGYILEADLGSSVSAGLEHLMAPGAVTTLSGCNEVSAAFSGATADVGQPEIETWVGQRAEFYIASTIPTGIPTIPY